MKKKLLLPLALLMALLSVGAIGEDKTVIYNGIITKRYGDNSYTNVYVAMDKESEVIKSLNPGKKIYITAVYPNWVEVDYNGKVGYILRHRIDVTSVVDPVNTPPYTVEVYHFYAKITRPTEVKADKSADSETLSPLTEGARIAIIGVEDGWAKLVYHRQYGYVDTRDLDELLPVAGSVDYGTNEMPLSVFTSFYSDNPDRINNLAVACAYMSKTLQPGEKLDFNSTVGPFNASTGYLPAPVLVDGETKENYGGGSCQVSSSLYNTVMQLPGVTILMRKPHGNNGASYLPHGMDASSGTDSLNLIIRNDYDFPIRIDASTHDFALFVSIWRADQ